PTGLGVAEEFYMRGNVALASGTPADAIARYRSATKEDPFFDAAIFGAGLAAREAQDLVGAAKAFLSVVRTEPRARDEFKAAAEEISARGTPLDLFTVLDGFVKVDPSD